MSSSLLEEVKNTFTLSQAIIESSRCLMCNEPPCIDGCPANVNIKQFIRQIRFGDYTGAINTIRENNILPGICARICPVEKLCEEGCTSTELTQTIQIAALQRFASEYQRKQNKLPKELPITQKEKIAIIGSGPAGLSCAAELIKQGYSVTIFENNEKTGGMMRYAIPEYRLPDIIIDYEINWIKALGVDIKTNSHIDDLEVLYQKGYDVILLASGLGNSSKMGLEGENLEGIYSALEFLKSASIGKPLSLGKRVAIIGGGNTAIDAACVAKRLGVEYVAIIYRRGRKEMPAYPSEVDFAWRENINFFTYAIPIEFLNGNGKIIGIKGQLVEWEKVKEGRPRNYKFIENSIFTMPFDNIILALGQSPQIEEKLYNNLNIDKKGYPIIKDGVYTNLPNVFIAGDIANRGETVVQAVFEGRKAAEAIIKYLIEV